MTDAPADGEVIFEVRRLGDLQRVAAIHVDSGTEVVVQGPAAADLRPLALKKLARALERAAEAPQKRPGTFA